MLRGQKGITLVALVVTIIVLIILAGVSITLLLGQYGVVERAREARNSQVNAGTEENEYLLNAEYYINESLATE